MSEIRVITISYVHSRRQFKLRKSKLIEKPKKQPNLQPQLISFNFVRRYVPGIEINIKYVSEGIGYLLKLGWIPTKFQKNLLIVQLTYYNSWTNHSTDKFDLIMHSKFFFFFLQYTYLFFCLVGSDFGAGAGRPRVAVVSNPRTT